MGRSVVSSKDVKALLEEKPGILTLAKRVILNAVSGDLDEAGQRVCGPNWPIFKIVLQPTFHELEKSFPSIFQREEADKAVEELEKNKALQQAINRRLDQVLADLPQETRQSIKESLTKKPDVKYSQQLDEGKIPPAIEADKYTSRLLKYIPAEVIALYLTLDALIRSSKKLPTMIYWVVFAFGIIGTYLYLWRVAKVQKQVQLFISVGAYCIWVFALGGPFVRLSWYDPIYAGLLLPIYTFVIAIIEA